MVYLYYFNTGLTIIAEEKDGIWEYPMVFQHQIEPNGRVAVMFQPMFMFSKDPKMTPLSLDSLLFKSEADEKMTEKYQGLVTQARSATSGLVIPGGPSISMKPPNIRKPSTNN